jgi:hypothetical protein
LEASLSIKAGRQLVAQALVLHKALFARRLNRRFVQAHGLQVPAFETSEFSQHQDVLVPEGLRTVVGPFAQPLQRSLKHFESLGPFGSHRVVERRDRQRVVEIIADRLDKGFR